MRKSGQRCRAPEQPHRWPDRCCHGVAGAPTAAQRSLRAFRKACTRGRARKPGRPCMGRL